MCEHNDSGHMLAGSVAVIVLMRAMFVYMVLDYRPFECRLGRQKGCCRVGYKLSFHLYSAKETHTDDP